MTPIRSQSLVHHGDVTERSWGNIPEYRRKYTTVKQRRQSVPSWHHRDHPEKAQQHWSWIRKRRLYVIL